MVRRRFIASVGRWSSFIRTSAVTSPERLSPSWQRIRTQSPALIQFVATDSRRNLGSINIVRDDEGTCDLFFMYTLAGDEITADELKHAAFIVATVANQIDDEVQQKFGGKRWTEIKG